MEYVTRFVANDSKRRIFCGKFFKVRGVKKRRFFERVTINFTRRINKRGWYSALKNSRLELQETFPPCFTGIKARGFLQNSFFHALAAFRIIPGEAAGTLASVVCENIVKGGKLPSTREPRIPSPRKNSFRNIFLPTIQEPPGFYKNYLAASRLHFVDCLGNEGFR